MSYFVYNTKSLVSVVFTLPSNLSYSVFLTTSFVTTLLNLLKSSEKGFNLSMSNLSTSVFKLDKLVFNAKHEVSTCEKFF